MLIQQLAPQIQKSLNEDFKIETLTPIQEAVIPQALARKNVIAISQTGSGKTLSYLLPLMSTILDRPKNPISLLIITPTKELSNQVLSVVKKVARHTNLISTTIYGGESFNEQTRTLSKGNHIVVACPGRLKDHIEKKTIDLKNINALVLDEADQLMDMGFYPDLKIILEETKSRVQTLLFSATFSEEVKKLTSQYLGDHTLIELSNTETKASIDEMFCPISVELKYPFLRFLLKHKKIRSALIFTRTKEEAKNLGEQLIKDQYNAVILQGDMSTHQRKKSIDALKFKNATLLVATDVAARGIDIPHVTHVINFSLPENYESYVHRVGRTARHENKGEAITLYTPEDQLDFEKIFGHLNLKGSKFKEFNYQLKIEKRHLKIF